MLFGRRNKDDEAQSQSQPKPGHTLDEVHAMLDAIGRSRLRVTNPRVKVLLTLIAQNGESYLTLVSGGEPTELQIMDFMDKLKPLQEVIEKYIDIQDNPNSYSDSEEKLGEGVKAVKAVALLVTNKSTSSERGSLTDFHVNTKILQSLSARNS